MSYETLLTYEYNTETELVECPNCAYPLIENDKGQKCCQSCGRIFDGNKSKYEAI